MTTVEEIIVRVGLRDTALATIGQTCGMNLAEMSDAWPEGVDSIFADLFADRIDRTTEALRGSLAHRSGPIREHDLLVHVLNAYQAGMADPSWMIISTEYAVRVLRHPEIAFRAQALRQRLIRAVAETLVEIAASDELTARRLAVQALDAAKFAHVLTLYATAE